MGLWIDRIIDWAEAYIGPAWFGILSVGGIAMAIPCVKGTVKAVLGL